MVQLTDKDSGAPIGKITEEQLAFLAEHLEEESSDDDDYYINPATLDMLEEQGGDAALLALLRKTLGDREEMEICWARVN